MESQSQRDESSDNACRSRASVGLDDVAIDDDGVFAEKVQVGGPAEGSSDKALDLLRSAGRPFAFAFDAFSRTLRQEGIFGGDPAAAFSGEPGGNFGKERGVADDSGVAHFDEDGAVRRRNESRGDFDGSCLVRFAVVCAHG